jgi:formylglycine-generating enzyme required for sulfatase activity
MAAPPTDLPCRLISPIDGAEMALVPAGPFTMGSEDGRKDQRPLHEVTLDAYYMDVYEVTNEQYG